VGRHQPRPRQPGEHPEPARPGGASTFKQTNAYEFKPYDVDPLHAIVKQRVELAFQPAPSNPTPACWWPTSWPRRAARPPRHRDPAEGWPHGRRRGPSEGRPRGGPGSEGAQPRLHHHLQAAADAAAPALVLLALARRLKHGDAYATTGSVESAYKVACEEFAPRPARTRSSGSTSNSSRRRFPPVAPLRQGQAARPSSCPSPTRRRAPSRRKSSSSCASRYRSNHSRASRCRSNHSCASECRSNHTTQRWPPPPNPRAAARRMVRTSVRPSWRRGHRRLARRRPIAQPLSAAKSMPAGMHEPPPSG